MALGAHTSIAGGVDRAILRGQEIGCETIQIFTKNARQWRARPLSEEEIARFRRNREETGIEPVFAHDSYLINLGSPDEALWRRSLEALLEEMARCEALDLPYLVIHPGSHVGAGEEMGLRRIAQALNRIHARTPGYRVKILLETTAGQGTSLGYRFEHLARLLELVEDDERLGVCFDTCHVLAAGYELRTPRGYAETFRQLDAIVGLDRLRVIHLNDSEGDLGSRVDRHAHIGQGRLGLEPFRLLLHDARFRDLPMVLETPKGADMDRVNLAVLKGLREGESLCATPPRGSNHRDCQRGGRRAAGQRGPHRAGHPPGGSAPRLRALLAGRQGPLAGPWADGAGARHRQTTGRGPRGPNLGREPFNGAQAAH